MVLPNFIGIGAQKAGTTPLFFLLRQHPDIFLNPQKETHFFSKSRHYSSARHYELGMFAGYRGQRAVGEISPEYMRTPGVARAIRDTLGQVKIIICLREPLDRAFSHYLHCLRAAEDNRSFFEGCSTDSRLPLWAEAYDDVTRAYIRGSWYPHQIDEWRREFGAENLFFCVLERDFATDGAKIQLIERLFRFLDVATHGIRIDVNIPNTSGPNPAIMFIPESGRAKWGATEIVVEPGDILIEAGSFRRVIRRPSQSLRVFFEKMKREMTVSLRPEDAATLRKIYFANAAERVSELIDQDLTAFWRRREPIEQGHRHA